ncbi:MAG TPA: Hsp20/alpha crystallin family protein [Desulfotignum sp.]|jgi:HSP20 family protein|nr:Hsp20/alpha crystallin family protein [Desulfotignum sp.]
MEQIEIRFGSDLETYDTDEKPFEEMFQSVNPMFCFSKRIWKPQMDIFETRSQIIIQAEIAGVKKEDIVIEVSNKAVKISGNRRSTRLDPAATYRLAEIQFGQFERVLYLPSVIDVEKVSAVFNNGFLQLTLGKQFLEKVKQVQDLSMDFI